MRERPILFSGPMVRAILAGTKTQTRRIVQWRPSSPADVSATRQPDEAQPYTHIDGAWLATWREPAGTSHMPTVCPYGVPGDRLWVREAHALVDGPCWSGLPRTAGPDGRWCYYREGFDRTEPRWRPSIHMPRWASRLTLRIESVRVERLRDITEADAIAEGVDPDPHPLSAAAWGGPHRLAFGRLWDAINGKRASWHSNPWVWVVTFEREVSRAE